MIQPVVGPVVDGKQKVTLNSKDGLARTVISTPDKVDEFLSKRKKSISNGLGFGLIGFGAAAGAAASFLAKMKDPIALCLSAVLGGILGLGTAAVVSESNKAKLDQNFINENV